MKNFRHNFLLLLFGCLCTLSASTNHPAAALDLSLSILTTAAITVYNQAGNQPSNTNLSGLTVTPSVFNVTASSSDIGGPNVSRTNFRVNGVVYSNSALNNAQVTISANNSSSGNQLNLNNGASQVKVALTGNVGSQTFASFGSTLSVPVGLLGGRAQFFLTGDVDESTFTASDLPGSYTGVITIAVTAP